MVTLEIIKYFKYCINILYIYVVINTVYSIEIMQMFPEQTE